MSYDDIELVNIGSGNGLLPDGNQCWLIINEVL